MKIDYSKLSFCRVERVEEDTEYPVMAFFNYDATRKEIDEWLAEWRAKWREWRTEIPENATVGFDEIPEDVTIKSVEFLLTIHFIDGKRIFVVEAGCRCDDEQYYWVEVGRSDEALAEEKLNTDEFISRIPNYIKVEVLAKEYDEN